MSDELLEALCRRLADDGDPVRSRPDLRERADRIVAGLRSGVDVTSALDDLDDQLLRSGYAAGLDASRIYRALPGSGHPVLEVLTCPAGRCDRVELPRTGATCAVFDRPMTLTRLRS
jgi:hypothetical protein